MLNTTRFANTRLDGFSVLEIQGEGAREFVPLRNTTVTGTVAGPLAELTLVQTFAFTKAAFKGAIEALYRFPLPGDAAVLGVTVRFGEVELVAELQERVAAEAEYESAKKEKRQAALVTRESLDVFTLQIAGILPDQEVQVTTHFVQLARVEENSQWSLRLPLTTAPRYVRRDEVSSPHAKGNPLFSLRDPGHRFSLDLTLKGATSASCSSHHPTLTVQEAGLNLRLESVIPNQDCVILWRAAAPESQVGLSVFTHENVFLAQVAPPLTASNTSLPREVIVLVDHSGSMEGAKWRAADWAVTRFLSSLTPQDRFALGLFHNNCRWFAPNLHSGTEAAIQSATAFLKQHKDTGGTELGVALEQALSITRMPGEQVARHVLIVTDAEVTDAGRLLNLVEREAKQPLRRRVSVLCIDAAPNSQLVLQLAEKGGGSAHFLTSDPEQDDITTALDSLLREWDAPLHTGLTLKMGTHTKDIGDLPRGQARWVFGELPPTAAETFTLESHGQTLATVTSQPGPAALQALWGVRRLNALEYLLTGWHEPKEILEALLELGLSLPELTRPMYAENMPKDYSAYLKKLLVEESLRSGVLCSQTGFVATRKERGKRVSATVLIANATPKDWEENSFGQPTGSFVGVAGTKRMRTSNLQTLMRGYSLPDDEDLFVEEDEDEEISQSAIDEDVVMSAFDIDLSEDDFEGAVLEMEFERSLPSVPAALSPTSFFGIPTFTAGKATLLDSILSAPRLLSALAVRFPDGAPATLDSGLTLLLYVDDLSVPRAQVRLHDLLRLGGERPLNLQCAPGAHLLLVLVDENGHWASGAPSLEVRLG